MQILVYIRFLMFLFMFFFIVLQDKHLFIDKHIVSFRNIYGPNNDFFFVYIVQYFFPYT